MDYEKKYKEALNKAKAAYGTGAYDDQTLEAIFPELTESEDERIRKQLVDIVAFIPEANFKSASREDCRTYLEKQKERGPLTKEEESILQEIILQLEDEGCPTKWKDLLHDIYNLPYTKQEEQNDEDEGCTDFTIYHPLKNGQGEYECIPYSFNGSLTSFSEDKDLIDFLRTCFYTKEECNEWIEQQKEQKPIRDIISGDAIESCMLRYLQSAANRKDDVEIIEDTMAFKKELLDIIKQEQKPWKVGANAYFTPEQKSVEWSEDIIQKAIKEVGLTQHQIDWFKTNVFPPQQEWSEENEIMRVRTINRLETLNFHGISSKEIRESIAWLKSLSLNLKKKNEHVAKLCSNDWSEEDEKMMVRLLDSINIGNNYEEICNWLLPKLKSLRSQPQKEIYQAAKHELAIKFMNYLDENRPEDKMSLSNAECEDIDKAFKENDWVKIMRYVEKYHSQLAEWSEEDKTRLTNILIMLQEYVIHHYSKDDVNKSVNWLKSLPERFNLQPKNEWSEEDEKTFWGLTAYIPNEELERLDVTRDDILKKLKSISLQPIQIEKEAYKDGFQTARHATALAFINYCDKIRPNGKMYLSNGECEEIEKAFLVGDWEKIERYLHKCQYKPSEEKYDGNMDKECIKLCDILNSISSIDTFESCCGHLKDRYSIWFFCNDIITISRLGRCVERNYSDGKWELLVDSTDTHPTGVFWLRSKVPFQSYEEMEKSVNELCNNIQSWFNTNFDSYFFKRDWKEVKQDEHWKPSEEQMKGLLVAIGDSKERGSDVVKPLRSLYYDLKKL